jgi:hypothetical protein
VNRRDDPYLGVIDTISKCAPGFDTLNREESIMEHHFTLGAHLLVWVFPLILVLTAIGDVIWSQCFHKDKS